MQHECDKGEEIAKIKMTVERLAKIIEGNGQKGLMEIVTIMNSNLSNMTDSIKSLNMTMNELVLYKSENEGYYKAKLSEKSNKQWTYGIVITLLGIIITLVIVLIK